LRQGWPGGMKCRPTRSPAAEMAESLVSRAVNHGAANRAHHLLFPEAGHTLIADGLSDAPGFLATVNEGLIDPSSTERAWQAVAKHLASLGADDAVAESQ